MTDRQSAEERGVTGDNESPSVSRRRLLMLGAWALLPAIAIGLTSCGTPQFDSERGVFVLRPKK